MSISPDKLDRYQDFVGKHTNADGNYDPEKGLSGVLTVLTPDPKLVVLAAMQPHKVYFRDSQLWNDVLMFTNSSTRFPITASAIWKYLEYRRDEEMIVGSLVQIGAVVQVRVNQGIVQNGYSRSRAGAELFAPLLTNVCNFVDAAEQSNPHQYNSMLKLLGQASSVSELRRPFAVYQVVKYLVEHTGKQRTSDIQQELGQFISQSVVSHVLNNLGEIGVIDYDATAKDIAGRSTKGWVTYRVKDETKLSDIDAIFQAIKRERGYFGARGRLAKVLQRIQQNPAEVYESNKLAEEIVGLDAKSISAILSSLAKVLVLELTSEFQGRVTQGLASANDLTRILYEMVLSPAKTVVETLTPIPVQPIDTTRINVLLENYQEEKTRVGMTGIAETRQQLINILTNSREPMKLSHLVQEYNRQSQRTLAHGSVLRQLNILMEQGLIKKAGRGYYTLA